MQAKVIAIANNKGGVGKTTSAISLATIFADWNFKVALIDNDPQGNVGVYLSRFISENSKSMADIYTGTSFKRIEAKLNVNEILSKYHIKFKQDKLDLFLSNQRLAHVAEDFSKVATLTEALTEIKSEYDLIIIDNGPYIGFLTRSALLAADMVLIPTEAGIGGLAGITQIIKEAETINARHWRKVAIRVFVNNFQYTDDFDINNFKRLKALVGNRLYPTYVPANRHVRKSKEIGLPIHLIDKIAKTPVRGAMAFRILAKNILQDVVPELFTPNAKRRGKRGFGHLASVYKPLEPVQHQDAMRPSLPTIEQVVTPLAVRSHATQEALAHARHPQPNPNDETAKPDANSKPHEEHAPETVGHYLGATVFSSRPIGKEIY